jgi:hypothetical protein
MMQMMMITADIDHDDETHVTEFGIISIYHAYGDDEISIYIQ